MPVARALKLKGMPRGGLFVLPDQRAGRADLAEVDRSFI
jgi:hypothetical protein